ncbi:transglutaminase domain-containing protein [Paenibacillus sp. CF384]|uniref:transglutaminase domain-containing protein n=1 Tax=Paenibacillus sp. CF384 TaxID=1884382 RepID=UPI000898D189|nr:transglutaminase domain-containing protein [Paenibacillus sp. CF384]SDY01430.1 Transglutaminase-like superfamily protein [Paenibacillus sp. CF384]
MHRLIIRLALVTLILFVGLGSDFREYKVVQAASNSTTLQELKAEILQQLLEQKPEISISYDGNRTELSEQFPRLIRDTFATDDYIAYIVDSYLYTIRTWGTAAKIKLTITYRETAEQTRRVDQLIAQALPSVVVDKMDPLEKVAYIHDWIVKHVAYDTTLQRYTAMDALETGTAVCQGYSLLAYRMLSHAGVESRIVEGKVDSGSHLWNLVRLNNGWHHMDVTWDDPLPDRPGEVSRTYFLKNDRFMKQDHSWDKAYPMTR